MMRRLDPREGLPQAGLALEARELRGGEAPEPATESGILLRTGENGEIEVTIGGEEPEQKPEQIPHDANLVRHIPQQILDTMAQELLDGIDADIDSRKDWDDAYVAGLDLLGLKWEDRSLPGSTAKLTGVTYPMFMDALTHFQAGASTEMLPAGGPVKAAIMGDATQDMQARARRKAAYLNFYCTQVDESYYPDFDHMLLMIGFCGNGFKNVYRDPRDKMPVAPEVDADSLIVNYAARSFKDADRITLHHRFSERDIAQMQLDGFYDEDIELGSPLDEEETAIEAALNHISGRIKKLAEGDERHHVFQCHCYWDIEHEGFEHVGRDGKPSGLPIPYVAHIHWQTRKIIGLYRDWRLGDRQHRRKDRFVHYKMFPGFGFYGWGFVQIMGALSKGSISILRQLIDMGSFASFPAWVHAKGVARPDSSTITLGPGQSVEIDTMGMPINQAMMPLPVQQPSEALFKFFQTLVESGRRLSSTTDVAVGDMTAANAPVGTTMAILEQAKRLVTPVQRRLHVSHRKELKLLSRLFAEDPMARYPFELSGQQAMAFGADFADEVNVVPVSDPNVPTKQQRIALSQVKLQIAKEFPTISDPRAAVRQMYQVLEVPENEIAELMPDRTKVLPLDPVSENMRALEHGAIRAGLAQNHVAHFISHISMALTPGLDPVAVQILQAHAQEHLAMHYRQQIEMAIGHPLPQMGVPLPPALENEVALVSAQVAEQVRSKIAIVAAQFSGQAAGDNGAQVMADMAELAFKREDAERKDRAQREENQDQQRRLEAQLADNAAERANRLQVAGLSLRQERIRAGIAARKGADSAFAAHMKHETAKMAAKKKLAGASR